MLRRHPVLAGLLLGILLLTAVLGYALITFDLNRYRLQLQQALSDALDRPVSLGEAHLSLQHGLAFRIAELRIGGEPASGPSLQASRLFLKLNWLPLFLGRVDIHEALLEQPELTIFRPGQDSPAFAGISSDALAEVLRIRTLHIRRGTFRLLDPVGKTPAFEVIGIEGRITDLFSDQPVAVQFQGDIGPDGAAGSLALRGAAGAWNEAWREAPMTLEASGDNLSAEYLLDRLSPGQRSFGLTGNVSLRCTARGVPASGVMIEGELAGHDAAIVRPQSYRRPPSLPDLKFSATWTADTSSHRFDPLHIRAEESELQGAVVISTAGQETRIEGLLSSLDLSWQRLRPYFPDLPVNAWPALLKKRLRQGLLRLESLRLGGTVAAGKEKWVSLVEEAMLRLRDGELDCGRPGMLSGLSVALTWQQEKLQIEQGRFLLAGGTFTAAGRLDVAGDIEPRLNLELKGNVPAERLAALFAAERAPDLRLSGPVLINGVAAGPFNHLLIDLNADLGGADIRLADTVLKPAGAAGGFLLTAGLTTDALELSHAKLSLPFLEVRGRGSWKRQETMPFSMVLDLAPTDLARTRKLLPALDRMKAQGTLALNLELSGSSGKIEQHRGTIFLRSCALRPTDVVAPITDITGQIAIDGNLARFEGLPALVGRSPLKASGSIRWDPAFRLDLGIHGKSVHADDLIFRSPEQQLQELDGRLVIDRDGILFDHIRTLLPQGTQALVDGRLTDYSAPRVALKISSETANIDEVIGLWQEPESRRHGQAHPPRPETWLTIDVDAQQGSLWNLQFNQASARITYGNGILGIRSLRFEAGGGTCSGQVMAVGRPDGRTLLKISGRMEQVDAAAIHNQLLKRRGLLSGRLEGNFYLEGEAGRNFLPSSLGGFDLRIEDGVLRKWNFLSKVFSLLNVSQIFSLSLPDMTSEGMPFNRITTTLSLRNGILGTEDLFVDSNAMNLSLVGSADLNQDTLDFVVGIKPLRTVDKIITRIPLAGWVLAGEEKALVTAHFQISGPAEDPDVYPIPITSVSEKAIGIFRRLFGLPGKLITDPGKVLGGGN